MGLLEETEFCDHDEGLNLPESIYAAAALIFLLLVSSPVIFLLATGNPDDLRKIEEALIKARVSLLVLSNLVENFTWDAAPASSSAAGSSRILMPILLEAASSSFEI